MIRVLALFALVLNTSCSALQAREEKVCKASLSKNIINPETLEFFDFEKIDQAAYMKAYEGQQVAAAHEFYSGIMPLAGPMSAQIAASTLSVMVQEKVKEALDARRTELKSKNPSFVKTRYKFEDEAGAKITKIDVCTVEAENCNCTSNQLKAP